jgi:hypothetical protein
MFIDEQEIPSESQTLYGIGWWSERVKGSAAGGPHVDGAQTCAPVSQQLQQLIRPQRGPLQR